MHLKAPPPAAKKCMKTREETHQTPHVVSSTESNENYVVSNKVNCMVKLCGRSIKNHTSFLPLQVLYCNSSSSGCQGPLKIKSELKI